MNAMLRQSAFLQWRISRWALLPMVLAGFGLPLLAMRQAQALAAGEPMFAASEVLFRMQIWTPIFPILAAVVGLTVGLLAWAWDHRGNHVYALSLPVPRWQYVLLKLAAGALILLVPVAAVLGGALLGAATTSLPDGLQAYPLAFTFRFLLAALILYALAFALAAGTMKTTVWLLSGLLLFVIFGSIASEFIEHAFGLEDLWTPIQLLHAALARWPGPFHVFGGSWMLIDV